MPDLYYRVDRPDPRVEAVLAFVFETLGVEARPAPPDRPDRGPLLVYGPTTGGAPVDGILIRRGDDGPFWNDLLDGTTEPAVDDGVIPFDLVAAIDRLLRDDVAHEDGPAARDGHGRLRFEASAPARAGYGEVAIVNRYVAFLGRLLDTRLGIVGRPRWPDGKRAAIGLSHDVDLPDRYALLSSVTRPWRFRQQPRTYARRSMDLVRARARDGDARAYWLFDDIADAEGALGFRSTFFFAAVPFHRWWGRPEDVAYDIGERRFERVFRSLSDRGFGIGLHASYAASGAPDRLIRERERLQSRVRTEIIGVRHHYWQVGADVQATLRAQEAAGFRYDTSLAFNDHVGFRRSVALPFRPFDDDRQGRLGIVELPTFCMDGNLFYRSDDTDAAVTSVDRLIEEIVRTGGSGVIDWHIQTSLARTPGYGPWGRGYERILEGLAARSDVWVTDLESMADWVARRREVPLGVPSATELAAAIR